MVDKTIRDRQAKRTSELDRIARRAGWHSWSVYSRCVKNGVVGILKNPDPAKHTTRKGRKDA